MEDSRVEAARKRAASGFGSDELTGLLDAYDERLRLNLGLMNENANLRKKLETQPGQRDGESLVPGLEKAYELINDALKNAP